MWSFKTSSAEPANQPCPFFLSSTFVLAIRNISVTIPQLQGFFWASLDNRFRLPFRLELMADTY
jgi:hypothetical protein